MLSSNGKSHSHLYNYTKIVNLDKSASVNFYGRVLNFKPPRPTRGSDWVMNLTVLDDSFEGRADLCTQNPAGMSVMIFKQSEHEFPAVKQVGDIVQFRHFRTQYYESAIQAISSKWSAFTVFRKETPNGPWKVFPEREIYDEEFEAVNRIAGIKIGPEASPYVPAAVQSTPVKAASGAATTSSPVTPAVKVASIRPSMTVSEVRHGIYFNGTFKVMKIAESSGDRNQFSLIVCDFTENPFLSANPESIGLPSHLNQCLLPVTIWDEFAEEARRINLKAGDYVYLDNLLGRQVRHSNGMCNVVAVLHGDPKAKTLENFIKIVKESKKIESQADRLSILKKSLESEEKIIEAAVQKAKELPKPEVPVKTAEKPASKPPTETPATEQIIRLKKQQTKRSFAVKKAEPVVTAEMEIEPSSAPLETVSSPKKVRIEQPPASIAKTFKFTTTSVGEVDYALTTILSVRSYPSDNYKFCVKAKITNFRTDNLYEMIRYVCPKCTGTTELDIFNSTTSCSFCGTAYTKNNPKFIWVFCMFIEDATGDLAIILADEDAEEFLGIPAINLDDPKNENRTEFISSIFRELTNYTDKEHLFCIKTYRVNNEDGVSQLRYRVFNTKLIQ